MLKGLIRGKKPLLLASFFLALYVTFVFGTYIYINVCDTVFVLFLLLLLIFSISFYLFVCILPWINHFEINSNVFTKEKNYYLFASGFLVTFFLLLLWFKTAYPGYFTCDSENQYAQAITGKYNDWHPIWHTFLFFTIPTKLSSNRALIVLLQIVYFSLAVGYMTQTIYEISNIKCAVVSCLAVILNPYVMCINMFAWKDVAFSTACLVSLTFLIRAKVNRNVSVWKLLFFGIVTASATLFRHNGILFTIPLLGFSFFTLNRRNWIRYCIFVILFIFIIKVPFYKSLGAEEPDKRVSEAMGLPLTIIGNVVVENLDQMDSEFQDFALQIAPKETWENDYVCGSFNSIKWNESVNIDVIEQKGSIGVIKEMLKCLIHSPKASFKALFVLTDMVYGLENDLDGDVGGYLLSYESSEVSAENLLYSYSNFVNHSCLKYLKTYGVHLLILIFFCIAKVYMDFKNSLDKIMLTLPIIIYDFGTMMLLTGPDSRFFYVTYLVTPIMLVYILCRKDTDIFV